MNSGPPLVTFNIVATDPEVRALVAAADARLEILGLNEHGLSHASRVSDVASRILLSLGYTIRQQRLAGIAGFLHDIGNAVSRRNHAATGALLAHNILSRLGVDPRDVATIMGAIGAHGDDHGHPGVATEPISATLILADKSDVHRSRVRGRDVKRFDRHDRIGFAVQSSHLAVSASANAITFKLALDGGMATAREFRDLFAGQLTMCEQAAETLACTFEVVISEVAAD